MFQGPPAGFPERRLALRILRRGLVLWVLVRLTLLAIQVLARGEAPGAALLALSPTAALTAILAVGGLGALEARRANEPAFLSNLGLSPLVLTLLVMLPAIAGEVAAGLVLLR